MGSAVVEVGSVQLRFAYLQECIGDATVAAHIPVTGPIELRNMGSQMSAGVRLKVSIPALGESGTLELNPLTPGETRVVKGLAITHRYRVSPRIAPEQGYLQVFLNGAECLKHKVTLLGMSDWAHDSEQARSLSCFVWPRHDVIGLAICDVGLRANSQGEAASAARRIYDYGQRIRSSYRETPVNGAFQRIRTPREVCEPGRASGMEGTCLDYAVFVASCLERVRCLPVIALTGGSEGRPSHACCGWWNMSLSPGQPVVRDMTQIDKHLSQGRLCLIDWVQMCNPAKSYADAETKAKSDMAAAAWKCLVDVQACREASICEMASLPWSAEATRILDMARTVAGEHGSDPVGTFHVAFAAFAANGAAMQERFCRWRDGAHEWTRTDHTRTEESTQEEMSTMDHTSSASEKSDRLRPPSAAAVASVLEPHIRIRGPQTQPKKLSYHVIEIQDLAAWRAMTMGDLEVTEDHLLFAIGRVASHNRHWESLYRRAGLDLSDFWRS